MRKKCRMGRKTQRRRWPKQMAFQPNGSEAVCYSFPREVELAMLEFRMYNGDDWFGNQHGGGSSSSGTIVVRGKRFRYWDQPDGTVLGGNKHTNPCFMLMYSRGEESVLHSVAEGADCSMDYGATSRDLVRAAVALAIHRGSKVLRLTDNSTKYLGKADVRLSFRLSDMNFLATGKTWYESVLPGLQPVKRAAVEKYRQKVTTNTWETVSTCLEAEGVDIDVGDFAGPAMMVFKSFKDSKTDFFARYGDAALQCSGILSLYGSEWSLDLVANAADYADIRILSA